MNIYVSVKQAGKRKEYITKKEFAFATPPQTLRELIGEMVSISVVEYNNKAFEPSFLHYLSPESIEDQAYVGKVGFGDRKLDRRADTDQAIATAILAFEDGLYRVWLHETELTALDEPLIFQEGDRLTFIRFTMLAGRMW